MDAQSTAQWAGVAAALVVGFSSLVVTCSNNAQVNAEADEQRARAARLEVRANAQDQREEARDKRALVQEQTKFAVYVELGDAPQETHDSQRFRDEMPQLNPYVWWAVTNASPIHIRDVWVEYPNNKFIWINEIPRCTVYALDLKPELLGPPPGVSPIAVYFKDPWNNWRRSIDGQLELNGWKETPREVIEGNGVDEDDGSAPSLPLSGCGT